jgi:L-alanine-DL-glutamate epimerase-like enolase superfamily enzyme
VTARAPQRVEAPVGRLAVSAYTVPTDEPESDGTFEWDSTTIVIVEAHGGGERGLGYTYGPAAAGKLVEELLVDVVRGREAMDVEATWLAMGAALRNAGRPGLGSMAIAAVDVSLWDLKARLLGVALFELLGAARESVPIYGSGGFTSYSPARVAEQLGSWAAEGIPQVKMKFGRAPDADPARLGAARRAIGDETELFVDANGAFGRKQAVDWAERLARDWRVSWFEEPVSSADVEGLHLVRERAPSGLDIAAGEYGYVLADFRNLLAGGAVDCLQADVTRCGGITGILEVGRLAGEYRIDLSGHCAPALSLHPLCGVERLRHLEWFHDHVRLEAMLFDGAPSPSGGVLVPDRSRPGLGLELKRADAERYAA